MTLISPMMSPPIQIARGAIASFRNPPINGANMRARPHQAGKHSSIFFRVSWRGQCPQHILLAVGTTTSSPKVRMTILNQKPLKSAHQSRRANSQGVDQHSKSCNRQGFVMTRELCDRVLNHNTHQRIRGGDPAV